MSGIKEQDLAHFLRLIRHRLGSAGVLAEFAGVGRCHLSSMLHGDQSRGAFTWPKVRRMVTSVEWSFLEQCSAWNSFKQAQPELADQVRRVPTVDDREQALMPVACSDCGHAIKLVKCKQAQGGGLSHGFCIPCYTKRLKGLAVSADEIATRLQAVIAADAADPAIVPLRPVEPSAPAELALFP